MIDIYNRQIYICYLLFVRVLQSVFGEVVDPEHPGAGLRPVLDEARAQPLAGAHQLVLVVHGAQPLRALDQRPVRPVSRPYLIEDVLKTRLSLETGLGSRSRKEPNVFDPLEPEPLKKKQGAGAAKKLTGSPAPVRNISSCKEGSGTCIKEILKYLQESLPEAKNQALKLNQPKRQKMSQNVHNFSQESNGAKLSD